MTFKELYLESNLEGETYAVLTITEKDNNGCEIIYSLYDIPEFLKKNIPECENFDFKKPGKVYKNCIFEGLATSAPEIQKLINKAVSKNSTYKTAIPFRKLSSVPSDKYSYFVNFEDVYIWQKDKKIYCFPYDSDNTDFLWSMEISKELDQYIKDVEDAYHNSIDYIKDADVAVATVIKTDYQESGICLCWKTLLKNVSAAI